MENDQTKTTAPVRNAMTPEDAQSLMKRNNELLAEAERLRKFVQQIVDAPDAMVCRLTRDAAKEVLDV